ncbi:MAG: ribonuclease Y [Tissierellia bacterium]|nr:ribonuclease Y [Tissierellia bacterium]
MEYIYYVIALIVGVIVGYFIVSIVKKKADKNKLDSAEEISRKMLEDASKEAENRKKEALLEAKDEIFKLKQEIEEEDKERRLEFKKHEKRLLNKEESLDKKIEKLDKKNETLNKTIKNVELKEKEVEEILVKHVEELERISQLTKEEAKEIIINRVKEDAEHRSALIIREYESKIKENQLRLSKEIITSAIQRYASDHVAESTVSVVTLPNDDMKGRIIGREGRNIRAFETLTGVDLIIDDTPEAIVLSSFDPIRREVAKVALEKLMLDGRIHPTRIEEIVEKAKAEVEEKIKNAGEKACEAAKVHGLHPEIVKVLGRLNYRTSYGQNVLWHSVECANIAGMIANELGINSRIARRGALLHDLGKAIDHEVEGTHVEIGVNLARRYKESKEVIHCIEAHHGDVEFATLEAMIVQASDAISAARPGARRESLQNYIQRLESLENIANSYEGVEKSFAIQAGREIRIMVQPERISEDKMTILAKDIATQIENELEYPGQIKINIIRETRSIEYAK